MANRLSMRVSTGESGYRVLPEVFRTRVSQVAEETVESLLRIWNEAGYEEVECQRLLGDLLNKLKITCTNELAAEQQILEHAKQEVSANVSEIMRMNDLLGRKTCVDHITKMNYTDKLAELERLLASVGEVYAQRQGLIDDELSSIQELAQELGEPMPSEQAFAGPPGTPALSDVCLNLMKDHTASLQSVRARRIEDLRSLARECVAHMADMLYAEEGFCTMADSDRFLSLDKQAFRFHQTGELSSAITPHRQTVVSLTQRLQLLADEKERRRQHLAATGDEIAKLWSLLRIPSVEREQFQSSFQRNLSMDTLSKGDDEVTRLQEIRRRSLGRVIACIRSDILTLWDEVGMDSDDLRAREFPLYFQEVERLEDSAVDLHEAYFNALRQRVEELRPILTKIQRRETIVQERIELEHVQMNPERLTARGPNAREERKREEAMTNRVKTLDKLTKEIATQIAAWEEHNGPFLYAGERYAERVTHQEENFIEMRDSLRNARKRKDSNAPATASTATLRGTTTLPSKKPATAPSSSQGPLATPHGSKKAPPAADLNASLASAKAAAVMPPAPACFDENRPPQAGNGRDSDSTVVRERDSTSSLTVVQDPLDL